MLQNNYKEIIEALRDLLKNRTTEDFVKKLNLMINESAQFCERFENDLGFNTVEQLKDNIVNDELKSNLFKCSFESYFLY